jgi:hypothetical protein
MEVISVSINKAIIFVFMSVVITGRGDVYLQPVEVIHRVESDITFRAKFELDKVASIELLIKHEKVNIPKEFLLHDKSYDYRTPYLFKSNEFYIVDFHDSKSALGDKVRYYFNSSKFVKRVIVSYPENGNSPIYTENYSNN